MDVEGKRPFNSQYIKDEEGRLLRDTALFRERWVMWFNKLLSTKPPTLDPSIVDELKQWPPCKPLDDVPFRYEVEEAILALANRKAVGPDGLPAEILKLLTDEGELDTLGKFHDIIVAVWKGGNDCGASQEERSHKVWQLSWYLPRDSRRQSTPQSSRGSPE